MDAKQFLRDIMEAILEALDEGPLPAGHLFAAVQQGLGASLDSFNQLIGAMETAGLVVRDGDLIRKRDDTPNAAALRLSRRQP